MTKKQSTKKGSTKGKAEGIKKSTKGTQPSTLTHEQLQQIETEAEGFKLKAHEYATKAYTAAVDHFERHHADPFALSRLAVVYDEQQPGDFQMVVTLPGVLRDRSISDEDIQNYVRDAERIARTLEDPECSEAYRKAFASIYTDHLLNISEVNWEHPAAVRLMIPLVMLYLWSNRPADADTALSILSITLRDALNSDEVGERSRVGAPGR